MYKYIYVEAKTDGVFRDANYKEVINEYSQKGYRFVTAIPKEFSSYGIIKIYDLVFEIEA